MQLTEKTTTPEILVSIGDANKAIKVLRTYGLSLETAERIISAETDVAVNDHGIIPTTAISPYLIEIFGEQHVEEAMEYAYLFMDDYDIEWCDYQAMLQMLLKAFEPEELMFAPQKIRLFVSHVYEEAMLKKITGEYETLHTAILSVLESIESRDGIVKLCQDPYSHDSIEKNQYQQ